MHKEHAGDLKDGTFLAELLKDEDRLARVVKLGPPITVHFLTAQIPDAGALLRDYNIQLARVGGPVTTIPDAGRVGGPATAREQVVRQTAGS